jgi:hypothetical protein
MNGQSADSIAGRAVAADFEKGWDCRVYLRAAAAFARDEASDQQRP